MSSKNTNNSCNFSKVSSVFSFGKSNLKKSIFLTSSALLLSSVCITKLYAGSACNVSSDWSGGTAPIDNSCTVNDATFNPQYSDHYVGSALADGAGTTLTLNGDLSVIKPGTSGISGLDRLGNLDPSVNGKTKLDIGSRNGIIPLVDAGGQSYTVNVYTNTSFATSDWGDAKVLKAQAVGDDQYISAGFGKASNGAHIDVKFDDFKGNNPYGAAQTTYFALKNSNLTWADGQNSVVEWHSKNSFESRAYQLKKENKVTSIDVPRFPYSFVDYKGETRQLSSVQDLMNYNSELVSALKDPKYPSLKTQDQYNAAFSVAQPPVDTIHVAGPGSNISTTDEIYEDPGDTRAMYASNGGKVIVKSGAQIDVKFDVSKYSGALVAEGGSSIEIENGAIVSAHGNSTVILGSDDLSGNHSTAINNGVINAGFRESYIHDTTVDNTDEFYYGAGFEAFYGGTATNNGIINVSINRQSELNLAYSNGFYLYSVGHGVNNGVVNLGINNDGLNGRNIGAFASGIYTTFLNSENGTIYIGRAAQYNPSDPESVSDTSNANNTEFYGILVDNNATATNDGKVIVGSKMQNAVAMVAVDDTSALQLINNGSIILNGDTTKTTGTIGARNYGLVAKDNGTQNKVINNGSIFLNGTNGVGVYVLSTKEAQKDAFITLTENSVITVSGSTQPEKLVRNYGVWVDGRTDDTHFARAKIDGRIKLTGDGAVGVYVRNGGIAQITDSANPEFLDGERQIGFYVYGSKSGIINSTKSMSVNTKDSSLFRIDGGAEFYGDGEQLKASTDRSIILEGTGRSSDGTQTKVLTKDVRLTVDGNGAIGVFINGGAYGQISDKDDADRQIFLEGDGAIGGVVDGRYHQLDWSYTTAEDSLTELHNFAKIDTNAKDVTGFITRNSALLVNEGVINMTNGINATGIHVIEGGRLENKADITIANGTGLHVEGIVGKDTSANVVNNSVITVKDGTAGIYLEKNGFLNAMGSEGEISVAGSAHGVLLASDAKGVVLGVDKITLDPHGTGNGIENNIVSDDVNFAAQIAFKQATIDVLGNGSGIRTAVALVSQYLDQNNTAQDSNVTINVSANGVGYDFRNAQLTDAVLNTNTTIGRGYTVNVSDHATGLRTYTTGEVTNLATVTMESNATGTAWLTGTASKVQNAGTLQAKGDDALLVDLSNRPHDAATGTTFINAGNILANKAENLAVKGSDQGDQFIFSDAASKIRGHVQAGTGADQLIWSGGTWEGGFDMGGGDGDQATIAGPVNTTNFKYAFAGSGHDNKLTLSNIAVSGGSFSNGYNLTRIAPEGSGVDFGNNWREINIDNGTKLTLTNDLTSQDSLDVNIKAGSTLVVDNNAYVGTNGHATIFSTQDSSSATVKLNNSGLIDMSASGSNVFMERLIIKGDYHSDGGAIRLNTDLAGDGAASDQLVIDGGKVTGTTTLYINGDIATMASQITKLEGIKVVDAQNGATTAADSFVIGTGWGRGYKRDDGIVAVAGSDTAYAYLLYRGSPRTDGKNDVYNDDQVASDWYLRSGEFIDDTDKKPTDPDNGKDKPGGNTGDKDKPGGDTGDKDRPGDNTGDQNKPGDNTDDQNKPGGDTGDKNKPGDNTGDQNKPGDNTSDQNKPGDDTGDKNKPGDNTGDQNKPGDNTDDQNKPSGDTGDKNKPISNTGKQEKPHDHGKADDDHGHDNGHSDNHDTNVTEDHNKDNITNNPTTEPVNNHPKKPFYGPSTPLYEAYPQVLLNLNRLSTLQQRVGNRIWTDGSQVSNDLATSDQANALIEHRGFWGRMEGSTGKVTPNHSPTEQNYDLDLWRMQAGVDGLLKETNQGSWIGSISGHYGKAEADIKSDDGHGKVETTGYGVGAAATWYGYNGTYVDLQSQATWYETDFNSKTYSQSDTKDQNGFGYALSVETGHRLEINNGWSVTPQVQLVFSSVDFDTFRDGLDTRVSLIDGDSLEGRGGIAINNNRSWKADNGDIRRLSLYGITNLYYEFLDGTKVDVSGTSFRNENKDFSGGLGFGSSYNWNNDAWSLYGEANVRSAFKNASDNYSFNGTIGLRAKF